MSSHYSYSHFDLTAFTTTCTMGNSSSAEIPAQYKRIVLKEPAQELENANIEVETVDMPKLKSGQVLIKVMAAPVNPSDYGIHIT